MAIELRPVRSGELARVHSLNQGAVPHVGSVSPETIEWFASEAAYFRVAAASDVVLAFLIGLTPDTPYGSVNFRWFRERYESFVYIDRIVVDEDAQRRGIGLLLYRDIEMFARSRAPVLAAEVNTRPRNDGSLAFHERFGFESVGAQDTEGGAKSVTMLIKKLEAENGA